MTKREKIIISAYTGFLMCDFADVHAYIEGKLGYSVWTHEIGTEEMQDKIHAAVKPDFLELCASEGD